jgi:hypothetical protein
MFMGFDIFPFLKKFPECEFIFRCLRLFEGEKKKHISDFPEGFKPTVYDLIKRGFVEKSLGEEETKRKVYGKRLVCTITEKGLKAHKALKTIESL